MQLEANDYVDGPIKDTLNKKGEMWVFGKDVKSRDVYIKISMGVSNSSAICISFILPNKKLDINLNNYEKSIYRRGCCFPY